MDELNINNKPSTNFVLTTRKILGESNWALEDSSSPEWTLGGLFQCELTWEER